MAAPLPSESDQKSTTCSSHLAAHLPASLSVASRVRRSPPDDTCDKELLMLEPIVSPSPTSTSSLFFGPASSINSLNSSFTSETESRSISDVESVNSRSIIGICGQSLDLTRPGISSAIPPTARSSLRQSRMGQSYQNKSPKSTDPLTRTRLKECKQSTEGFPVRIRLLDGEEQYMPATLRNSYTAFTLSGPDNNIIRAPPNRTVDHSVCENFAAEGHRCGIYKSGDSGHCDPCPPPYRSHFSNLGDSVVSSSKKDSSSSRTGKFKEVMKTMFDRVVRPNCRSESEKSAKPAARSSSCSNDTMTTTRSPVFNHGVSSHPVSVTGARRSSPSTRLPSSASARTGAPWPAQFSGAPPPYDTVMKENKSKQK